MKRIACLVLCVLPGMAWAEQTSLVVPGQGWQLSVDIPRLKTLKQSDVPGQYMYFGNSEAFNLSLYVEDPACPGGASHRAFYDCFWPKASRNPLIKPSSVSFKCSERYCRVQYEVELDWNGQILRQLNVNYLIAYHGKWTDLHVSVIEPDAEGQMLLDAVERSLGYGELPQPTPAANGYEAKP